MSTTVKMCKIFVASLDSGLSVAVQKLLPSANIISINRNVQNGISESDKELLENSAEILLADQPVIQDVIHTAKNLKWAASTWAGVDSMIKGLDPQKPLPYLLTRTGGAFNKIMAEYVLGYVLTKERSIVELTKEQESCHWNNAGFKNYRSLSELTIGILGVGEIGSEVARLCNCAGMTVIGITRTSPEENRKCPAVSMYRITSELPEVLQQCDYVCNILPSTADTRGLLSNDMFSHCQNKKSIFINIGRGDITDEDSIIKAVTNGWLGGAILDVFSTEPLPADSRLWKVPGVIITPHVAGVSLSGQVAMSFVENYKLYTANKPLKFQVDVKRGY